MNKIFLIGNLTRDPELKTTPNGVSVCTFTVAVNRRGKQSAEAGQPEADFFRVSAWRQLGENCHRFLAKGRKVGVSGTLTTQTYTGSDGQPRFTLEVNADDVEFLTPRGDAAPRETGPGTPAPAQEASGFVRVDDDDLPF